MNSYQLYFNFGTTNYTPQIPYPTVPIQYCVDIGYVD